MCVSLSSLSVNGRAPLDSVIFPDEQFDFRYQHAPFGSNNNFENGPLSRTTRQGGNRRQTTRRPQTSTTDVDPFEGLDPQLNNQQSNFNNRPSSENQDQWFNNNGNRNPGQQQGFGNNRPQGQNQGFNNGNFGQGSQWGGTGNRPSNQNQGFNNGNFNQGFQGGGSGGNRPSGQNQNQGFNNGNQGQGSQWGTGNRPLNQNQGFNNGNSNQGFQGGSGGNRPSSQNQNQEQTTSTSSSNVDETLRNTCNTSCREMTTNEFNPVCGSDSQTYQNMRFLDCIRNCGIRKLFTYYI